MSKKTTPSEDLRPVIDEARESESCDITASSAQALPATRRDQPSSFPVKRLAALSSTQEQEAQEQAFPVPQLPCSPFSENSPTNLKEENLSEPQNEQPPSLLRTRSFAALIDFSVASSFFVLALLLFPDPPRIIPCLLGALYLATKDSLVILNGQSIGKKLMKIRAVNRNQLSLAGNYKTGLKRNLSWIVAPVEFAILYVREDEVTIGKRLGDDWAATEVVTEKDTLPRKSKWLP